MTASLMLALSALFVFTELGIANDAVGMDGTESVSIYQIYKTNDFTKLDSVLQSSDLDNLQRAFFQGQLEAARGHNQTATKKLIQFLGAASTETEWQKEALMTLGYCYFQDGEYQNASKIYARLLMDYSSKCSESEKEQIKQNLSTTAALKGIPPQSIERSTDVSTIGITQSASGVNYGGFIYMDLRVNGTTEEALFDTGANVNAASASFAKRHKLRLLPDLVSLTSATGKAISTRLAIADQVQIGGFIFHNVVFSVIEDNDLIMPSLTIPVVAVVGLPLMIPMNHIRIDVSANKMVIGQSADSSPAVIPTASNLAFFRHFLLLTVQFEGKNIPFLVDSGADRTYLFRSFLDSFVQLFASIEETKDLRIGTGAHQFNLVKILPELELFVNGCSRSLRQVAAFADNMPFFPRVFGSIGADFLKKGYEIDFQRMHFSLLGDHQNTSNSDM